MTGKRQKLHAAIERAIDLWCSTPFEWGASDCLLALADIIAEARGFDPAAEFRGRYHSPVGALRVTRRFGGFAGALQSAAVAAGWGTIEPKCARTGDIGIISNEIGPRCGVIRFGRLWVGRAERGFCAVPTRRVALAWSVD